MHHVRGLMVSKKMGRRKFIKRMSSVLLGMAITHLWKADLPLSKTDKITDLEYPTLGRPGLKVDAWG